MPSINTIQPKIQRGYGKVGTITGQTYDVYRLNPKSTGSIVQQSNLIYPGVKCSFQTYRGKHNVETHYFIKVPVFEGFTNTTNFLPGDVFVERANQTYTDGSAFTFAYKRPVRFQESQAFLFVQTPLPVTITRSEANPNHLTTGLAPYQGMNKSVEQTLTLLNGMYSFKPAGMYPPAAVYIGLNALSSAGEQPPPPDRLPTEAPRQSWDVFVSLLPGTQLVESDIVNAANGDRYFMRTIFPQYVGFQGIQISAQKLRV